jgi:uncharacterized protein YjbI with pentapeptide repeats
MKWPGWTGVGERTYKQPEGTLVQPSKTAWDWLQLLIVPAILAAAVTLYNYLQTGQQDRRSNQTAQDTTLDAYFLQMSDLLLRHNLLHAGRRSPVRAVADAITGAAIIRLNTKRQGEVARFVSNARVPDAYLRDANLTNAPLFDAHLIGADLQGADLQDARLRRANLVNANLTFANLSGANLIGANLGGATLPFAHLNGAELMGANLRSVDLLDADLSGADLSHADFRKAKLGGVNFSGAELFRANLTGAHLNGAEFSGANFLYTTCPDGKITNSNCKKHLRRSH